MAAPKGNQFWKLRSTHGRDKLFATPTLLLDAACEYFNWCDENPWLKAEQVKTPAKAYKDEDGNVTFPPNIAEIPTARPYTIQGLCLYLDCNPTYLNDFESGLKVKEDQLSKDFSQVVARIRDIIYQQKFEGAAVGAFNASIIARDLNLREQTTSEVTGKDGGPIQQTFDITLKLH